MKLWHFEISNFFGKYSLTSPLWIFKWVSWWCHRLTICHVYYTFLLLLLQIQVKAYPCIKIYQTIHYFSFILSGYKAMFTVSWLKYEIFVISIMKCVENCEEMTSSTHSFEYSYGVVKKCFPKECEISKCHNFLISYPIFIIFAPFCRENFVSFLCK